MNFFQGLVLILAISAISAQEARKLFDLNQMYEQGTLLNFLADVKGGAPVSIESCQDKPIFQSTKITVDPTEIIKGQNISIKVVGVMLSDQVVNKLHLDTYYNGSVIYTADVDKKNAPVKKGPYGYNYEASVPTFTPSGKWEIFIYLLNDKQEKLSCQKATFNMP
jgi:hypothetical protein